MRLLTFLLGALFAGQASGAPCPPGVVGNFFDAVAGVDKSFHRKISNNPATWHKAICTVLKLAQSVDVTLGIDVSYWKLAFLSKADQKIVGKDLNEIKGLRGAWKPSRESAIKWVVEAPRYFKSSKILRAKKRQLDSDKKVLEYLVGDNADVVRADKALDRDYFLPAEAVLGALVAKAADAGTCAMAVFTGDFDAILSRCWICPSVPKSGHSRLDMTTHTTIWDRDKFLSIAKINLRMLAMLFALAFTAMLKSFRGVTNQPTLNGGVIMKMWADAFGDVARALWVSLDQVVDDFLAKVASRRQNIASASHFSVASPSSNVSTQLSVLNNTVDAAVALPLTRYQEFLRRDKHYKESAELRK